MIHRIFLAVVLATLMPLAAAADVSDFVTPSGNIYCQVGGDFDQDGKAFGEIYCRIHDFEANPAYPGCRQGLAFSMGDRGGVNASCDPGPRPGGQFVADYGQTGEFIGIACTSERTGLTCRNSDGRGFSLSRRAPGAF
ncbi:MAG: DUF6636 domain-containing protein [Pseudomonadota bacterium]